MRDDGAGFDPDAMVGSGAGSGLRDMARRAEAIGGRLRIASQPGDGAHLMGRVAPAVLRRERAVVTGSAGTLRPIRVLLVDDHAVVRKGLSLLLERDPRFRVVGGAGSVAEAAAAARRVAPDVVVIDMRLPDGSGVDG